MRGSKASRVHSTLTKNSSAELSRNLGRSKAISRLYREISAQPATRQMCMCY